MITELFLDRLAAGTPEDRIAVIAPLARAYLCPELGNLARGEIAAGFVGVLGDPDPRVRRALAEALADAKGAPHHLVSALAFDQINVALPVLQRSPVLTDHELVELIAEGQGGVQMAVAGRQPLSAALAAALVEICDPNICLRLLSNPGARILPVTLARMAERHSAHAALRSEMLARGDLPVPVRQGLTLVLAEALCENGLFQAVVPEMRARRMMRECCDQATVDLAGHCLEGDRRALIAHLNCTGHMTPGLLLRALIHGHVAFFIDTLAFLADLPPRRAARLAGNGRGSGFLALYEQAGLPETLAMGFAVALAEVSGARERGEDLSRAGVRRQVIECVQAECAKEAGGPGHDLAVLLTRLADAASREEARAVYWEDAAAA